MLLLIISNNTVGMLLQLLLNMGKGKEGVVEIKIQEAGETGLGAQSIHWYDQYSHSDSLQRIRYLSCTSGDVGTLIAEEDTGYLIA